EPNPESPGRCRGEDERDQGKPVATDLRFEIQDNDRVERKRQLRRQAEGNAEATGRDRAVVFTLASRLRDSRQRRSRLAFDRVAWARTADVYSAVRRVVEPRERNTVGRRARDRRHSGARIYSRLRQEMQRIASQSHSSNKRQNPDHSSLLIARRGGAETM